MSTIVSLARSEQRQHCQRCNYINKEHGLLSVAAYRRPQAHRHALPHQHHRSSSLSAASLPAWCGLELLTPKRRPDGLRHLQQDVHDARHRHDLPVSGAVRPGHARQLLHPHHDRREGSCLPKDQPAQLVPLPDAGGIFVLTTLVLGGVDTGWTFTTPLSTHYLNTHVVTTATAIFIAGFSSIFTGLNFHRDRCTACARRA